MLLALAGCTDHAHDDHSHDAEKSHASENHGDKTHDEAGYDINDYDTPEHDSEDHGHEEAAAHGTETRSADSHVHGDAVLAMALDGSRLTVELETPLYNFVGFERAPDSEPEKLALKAGEKALANPAQLFLFNSEAKCEPEAEMSPVSLMADHDGHEDSYDQHHDDEEHEDEEHGEEQGHQDVIVEYVFNCVAPNKLKSVQVNLFQAFPNMTELDTIYLGPSTQSSSTLKPNKTQFSFLK